MLTRERLDALITRREPRTENAMLQAFAQAAEAAKFADEVKGLRLERGKLAEREQYLLRQLERCGCRRCDAPACNCGGYHNNAAELARQKADALAAESAALRKSIATALAYAQDVSEALDGCAVRAGAIQIARPDAAEVVAHLRAALSSPSRDVARIEAGMKLAIKVDAEAPDREPVRQGMCPACYRLTYGDGEHAADCELAAFRAACEEAPDAAR